MSEVTALAPPGVERYRAVFTAREAARREVQRRGAAQAARADEQRAPRPKPLLSFDPDLGKKDVAAVAEELLVVQ